MNMDYDSNKVEEIKDALNSAINQLKVNESKRTIIASVSTIVDQLGFDYYYQLERLIQFPETAQRLIKDKYNSIVDMETEIEKFNNGSMTREKRLLADTVTSILPFSNLAKGMFTVISATTAWFKGYINVPALLSIIGISAMRIFTPGYATIDIMSIAKGKVTSPVAVDDETAFKPDGDDDTGTGDGDAGAGDAGAGDAGAGDDDDNGNGNVVYTYQPRNEETRDPSTTEEANTNIGKKDEGKSDDKTRTDIDKTEPVKDTDTKKTDTKEPDKIIENKPQPDVPTTITDNKGSSGVSHGSSSSSLNNNSNGNGNYTFTNSGISASQDEPIESLTDENPAEESNATLPVDEEDVYTIPTDLSGVTSKTKHSSGSSGVIPILGGLGAAAAVGVGAKIYMDNKKNNDNDEDSSESDEDNTEDWDETSNENDGILADEWNEDDSNFEFDDTEPNTDSDEYEFGEI